MKIILAQKPRKKNELKDVSPLAGRSCYFHDLLDFVFHNDFADQNRMIHFMKKLSMIGALLLVFALGNTIVAPF